MALLAVAGNRWCEQIVADLRKVMKLNRHHSLFKQGRLADSLAEHRSLMAGHRGPRRREGDAPDAGAFRKRPRSRSLTADRDPVRRDGPQSAHWGRHASVRFVVPAWREQGGERGPGTGLRYGWPFAALRVALRCSGSVAPLQNSLRSLRSLRSNSLRRVSSRSALRARAPGPLLLLGGATCAPPRPRPPPCRQQRRCSNVAHATFGCWQRRQPGPGRGAHVSAPSSTGVLGPRAQRASCTDSSRLFERSERSERRRVERRGHGPEQRRAVAAQRRPAV